MRMNDKSRTHNTIFNALTIVLNFLTRIVFIKAFGENYLGINGLFSNILSVLALAELGVSGAIVYCMYKPIVEKDYKHLAALMNYYKKLYQTIGIVVAILGLLVVPFLSVLVNIEANIGNITFYYLLYLLNTVASYFLVYKTSILTADQKDYVIKICKVVISVIQFCVLSIVALQLHNFYIYLLFQIGFSILNNYICSKVAERMYPFINEHVELPQEEKRQIWNNISSMFSYQIGNVILNNTDNILISVMISTIVVGYYSNYSMIVAAISTFIQLIFGSVTASIGNLVAEGNESKQRDIFNVLQLMSFWVTSFSVICFCVLFQDCISILYTTHYLLNYDIVIVCAFNFYIVNILYPIYCYRNTVGLFKDTKMIMLFTSLINLVLSIILGKVIGLFGILVATGLSRILTNFWFEPIKLFKKYFKASVFPYFLKQIISAVLTVILCAFMVKIA